MKPLKVSVAIILWAFLLGAAVSYASSTDLFKAVTAGDVSAVKDLLDRV